MGPVECLETSVTINQPKPLSTPALSKNESGGKLWLMCRYVNGNIYMYILWAMYICGHRSSVTKVTVWYVGWKVGNFFRIKYYSFILLHSIVSHTGDNPLDIEFVNYNRDI